jgi:hypothetical protein
MFGGLDSVPFLDECEAVSRHQRLLKSILGEKQDADPGDAAKIY